MVILFESHSTFSGRFVLITRTYAISRDTDTRLTTRLRSYAAQNV